MEQPIPETIHPDLQNNLRRVVTANPTNYLNAYGLAKELNIAPEKPSECHSKPEEIELTRGLLRDMLLTLIETDMGRYVKQRTQFEKPVNDERRRTLEKEYLGSLGFKNMLSSFATSEAVDISNPLQTMSDLLEVKGERMQGVQNPNSQVDTIVSHLQDMLE